MEIMCEQCQKMFVRLFGYSKIHPYTSFSRFKSTKKKVVVKATVTKVGKKPLETKSASDVIKRLNWENQELFGSLLKTTKQRREENEMGMLGIEERIQDWRKAGVISNNINPSLVIHSDHGYKDLTTESMEEMYFVPTDGDLDPAAEVPDFPEDTLREEGPPSLIDLTSSEPKELCCPQEVEIRQLLKFPIINPWRHDSKKTVFSGFEEETIVKELDSEAHYPSVTKILRKTMPAASVIALERWKKKMVAELGEEGFQTYQQEILDNGASLHQSIVSLLEGIPPSKVTVALSNAGHWRSLQTIFPHVREVELLEKPVIHPYLRYRGVVDCVAKYRNQLVVVDWKTSKKLKPTLATTFDSPVQAAAYVGALNFDTNYRLQVDGAVVVIAYESGEPCHIHHITPDKCLRYWKDWLHRLKQFWEIVHEEKRLIKS
ncbi:LOW QUALITY PROTEIN: mitochondrial genome maintenance exonuclease 1-like [Tachypleus tridentatus]|uniref:LOW QUALITY PROTEIN: mitochondrial genome maintenance exonuclease 1-like n=1 Tax=Tachypleus tridentatus TaxID=6853 RepID=UPI003FD01DEB